MPRDSFNADFYVVAATILPVLYLALVLQGGTYEKLLSRSEEAWRNAKLPYEVYVFWRLAAYALWSLWLTGEAASIWALYTRSDIPGSIVLVPLAFLILALTAGPVATWFVRTPPGLGKKAAPPPTRNPGP
jgi:hypothetical protein